jgi:hypothetical protein
LAGVSGKEWFSVHPNLLLGCWARCVGRREQEAGVVTDRDRSVGRWVAVIGAVSGGDVMARFRLGPTADYRRLAALVDHGVLARARLVYGAAGALHGDQ